MAHYISPSSFESPLRNCEWLIISVPVLLKVPYYKDNCSNSRANACTSTAPEDFDETGTSASSDGFVVNHNHLPITRFGGDVSIEFLP